MSLGKAGLAALRKREQDPERKKARALGLTVADYRKLEAAYQDYTERAASCSTPQGYGIVDAQLRRDAARENGVTYAELTRYIERKSR